MTVPCCCVFVICCLPRRAGQNLLSPSRFCCFSHAQSGPASITPLVAHPASPRHLLASPTMDMPSSDNGSSSTMDMEIQMLPYLHFQGGDFLLFKAWVPRSSGAIAGACIGLVVFAILERLVTAWRSRLEDSWAALTHHLLNHIASSSEISTDEDEKGKMPETTTTTTPAPSPQLIPPFILSHDLSRGAMFALQALMSYVLMLAVMTFNAAYLISILAGLGIGEAIFGRWKGVGAHASVH
ncbi:Ctr copper transporter family-domain-containing protein [Schizophyllum commune]